MSKIKIVFPAAILVGGFLLCSTASMGKQEYTKQTKKACIYCHTVAAPKTKDDAKTLKDPGKYFAEHKSLDGYIEKK